MLNANSYLEKIRNLIDNYDVTKYSTLLNEKVKLANSKKIIEKKEDLFNIIDLQIKEVRLVDEFLKISEQDIIRLILLLKKRKIDVKEYELVLSSIKKLNKLLFTKNIFINNDLKDLLSSQKLILKKNQEYFFLRSLNSELDLYSKLKKDKDLLTLKRYFYRGSHKILCAQIVMLILLSFSAIFIEQFNLDVKNLLLDRIETKEGNTKNLLSYSIGQIQKRIGVGIYDYQKEIETKYGITVLGELSESGLSQLNRCLERYGPQKIKPLMLTFIFYFGEKCVDNSGTSSVGKAYSTGLIACCINSKGFFSYNTFFHELAHEIHLKVLSEYPKFEKELSKLNKAYVSDENFDNAHRNKWEYIASFVAAFNENYNINIAYTAKKITPRECTNQDIYVLANFLKEYGFFGDAND